MIILTIRTDRPEAEIGLFNDSTQLAYEVWEAHRKLAETIHLKIKQMLTEQQFDWQDIAGVIAFQGPGSFTGLRIGLTVANTLADALSVPIVGTMADDWIANGQNQLQDGKNDKQVIPEYGALPNVTSPRK